jgi:hypothetical protein
MATRFWIKGVDDEDVAGPFYDESAAKMCLDALQRETGRPDDYRMVPPSREAALSSPDEGGESRETAIAGRHRAELG